MPYLLLMFTAGVLIGKKWETIRRAIAPIAGGASAKFDELYSETARKVGTKVEDFEDGIAERRFRSRMNGHGSG
jgi:hypothetical protein